MRQTNARIVRRVRTAQGVIIKTEIGGEYFSPPFTEAYLRKELAGYQAEEPNAGWALETRGTESNWHEWKLQVAA